MTIEAKVISKDGSVRVVRLDDDPSDSDISRALGGSGNEPRTYIGEIGAWEAHSLESEILIIGKAPFISDNPKLRKSCNLSDEQTNKLAKIFWEAKVFLDALYA